MRAIHKFGLPARTGFTLLELLAAVTIIGILAAIIIPRIGMSGQYAKVNVCKQYKADLETAIEKYRMDTGVFPSDLSMLENDTYYPEAIPVCPVNNAAYTIDAITNRIAGHNH